ncbi:MAG: hypothetical protein ACRC1V_12255, partial [Plesiomonas sp.]
MTESVARIALPVPLPRLFDYLLPAEQIAGQPVLPGMRVKVPFGRRELIGVIESLTDSAEIPHDQCKAIIALL